jgi:putative effector of murein hydrolase
MEHTQKLSTIVHLILYLILIFKKTIKSMVLLCVFDITYESYQSNQEFILNFVSIKNKEESIPDMLA